MLLSGGKDGAEASNKGTLVGDGVLSGTVFSKAKTKEDGSAFAAGFSKGTSTDNLKTSSESYAKGGKGITKRKGVL